MTKDMRISKPWARFGRYLRPVSFLAPVIMLGAASTLVGCSVIEPEYSECPSIKTPIGGEQTYAKGQNLGQIASIRFNGIYGQCVQKAGYTDTNITVHILMERDMRTGSNSEVVELHLTAAIIDPNDQVTTRQVISDEVAFSSNLDRSFPIIDFNLDVPDGHRVLLGLGRAAQ